MFKFNKTVTDYNNESSKIHGNNFEFNKSYKITDIIHCDTQEPVCKTCPGKISLDKRKLNCFGFVMSTGGQFLMIVSDVF